MQSDGDVSWDVEVVCDATWRQECLSLRQYRGDRADSLHLILTNVISLVAHGHMRLYQVVPHSTVWYVGVNVLQSPYDVQACTSWFSASSNQGTT